MFLQEIQLDDLNRSFAYGGALPGVWVIVIKPFLL
jgi:hypothetical protein